MAGRRELAADEQIETTWVPFPRALAMVQAGEIRHPGAVMAILYAAAVGVPKHG